MNTFEPCACWTGPAFLHDGHCCFGAEGDYSPGSQLPCGHGEEGMRLHNARKAAEEASP